MLLAMGHEELILNSNMLKMHILCIACEVETGLDRVPWLVFGIGLTSTSHW